MLKEGDRVEIRCLADGNPPPHFSISKQVQRASWGADKDIEGMEVHSTHPCILSQNLSTREVMEEAVDDNGVLVLKSAHKEHSGLYECQGLDLETMALLSSDQQELLVNCEELRAQYRGTGLWQKGICPPCPPHTDTVAVLRCV